MDLRLRVPSQQKPKLRTSTAAGLSALLLIWFAAAPSTFADHKHERRQEKETGRGASQTAFIYQGQLRDEGAPSTGVYDLLFKLYPTQTGGDEIGSISFDHKELTNGLFKLELDFGAVLNDGKESWLEIAVRPTGSTEPHTVLSPRQHLTATPYAVFAQQERWSLIGMPVGFVGAPEVSKGMNLANGDPAPAAGEPAQQTRSKSDKASSEGKVKPQVKDEAAGWTDEGTVIRLTTSTDRVGIGTTTPGSTKLGVFTTANEAAARFEIDNASNTSSAVFLNTNGTGDALRVRTEGTGRAAHFSINNANSASTVVSVETVRGTGVFSFSNLGTAMFGQSFSTTKPAGRFQIFNTNSDAPALVAETNGDGEAISASGRTGVASVGTVVGVSGLSLNGTGVSGITGAGTAGRFTIFGVGAATNTNPSLDAVTFGRGPAGRFRILNSSNPSAALDVSTNGTNAINAVTTGTGFAGVFQVNNPDSEGSALYVSTNGRGPAARINGRTVTEILEITGGADLAERFTTSEAAIPGMVVAIDPDHPGQLCIARGAYNRRVAGVISGANDLNAGMVLADLPGAKDSVPLALSGRAWVNADATTRPINPGDLLTTSDRPGYAMRVLNHAKAQGAIIGKAMTGLKKGETGRVLVLINLQ